MRLLQGLIHFCFACIPGCGQMYQGYMKRGISQTVVTTALVFIAVFLEMGVLALLLLPVWLYSFFDSYNLRRQIRYGMEPEDAYMFGMSDLDSLRLSRFVEQKGRFIGWILVVLGLFNLYILFARSVFRGLRDLFPFLDWLYDLMVWNAPRIMATVLIVALGLWFIRGPKTPHYDGEPDFTPPPPKPKDPPEMNPSAWTEGEKKFHEEPEPKAPDPVVLTWESEFNVEKFQQEEGKEKEGGRDSGAKH